MDIGVASWVRNVFIQDSLAQAALWKQNKQINAIEESLLVQIHSYLISSLQFLRLEDEEGEKEAANKTH